MSFNFLFFYRKYFLSRFYLFEVNKGSDIKYNNLPIINKPLQKNISTQTSYDNLSILIDNDNDSDDNNDNDNDYDDGEIPSESFISAGIHLMNLSQ